mgnify:CR=1 FL=1
MMLSTSSEASLPDLFGYSMVRHAPPLPKRLSPRRGVSKHRNFEAYALDHREMGYIGPISTIYSHGKVEKSGTLVASVETLCYLTRDLEKPVFVTSQCGLFWSIISRTYALVPISGT